jgi:CTP:phosphocholine cytidylyltransferase-like protein
MKAIILSAGQGRRLLPYTKSTPKCLLELSQKPFITARRRRDRRCRWLCCQRGQAGLTRAL